MKNGFIARVERLGPFDLLSTHFTVAGLTEKLVRVTEKILRVTVGGKSHLVLTIPIIFKNKASFHSRLFAFCRQIKCVKLWSIKDSYALRFSMDLANEVKTKIMQTTD